MSNFCLKVVVTCALAVGLPTLAWSRYPGFEAVGWVGLLAPTGTPKEIVARLNAEVVRILGQTEIKERFVSLGAELVSSTPEEFGAYIRLETAKWGQGDQGLRREIRPAGRARMTRQLRPAPGP